MTRIRRTRDGRIAVTLSSDEFIALTRMEADLLGTLADRLRSVADGAVVPSPLFPDAYRDDDEASAEFHSLTDVDLVTSKSGGARGVMDAFTNAEPASSGSLLRGPQARTVTFDDAGVHALLRNVTDLRLLLADRLAIEHDGDDGLAGAEHDLDRALYWWLGETQERLVAALSIGAFGRSAG
ncbi:DUF2017 family protein [Rathayibacter sp. CAU 1779]